MMADVRHPVHQGSQLVKALWFDAALHGEAEARKRVLAHWESGARAWRLRDGYLLEWPRARRLLCERAPGLPLCDQDGVLTGAPLPADARAAIAGGSVVLVSGAAAHVFALTPDWRVDPSEWLDLAALPVCVPLTLPADATRGFVARVPAPAADVRTLLGNAVPAASPRQQTFLRRLHERHGDGNAGVRDGLARSASALGALAAGAVGLLALLPLRLLDAVTPPSAGHAPERPRAPSARRTWINQRLTRLALLTRVSSLLGWRQARYLRKMLDQFERGDLDEALRHAIALDSLTPADRTALGVPGRRARLTVRGRGASTAGIGLDAQSTDLLRAAYRRSFDQLDRAGRIDEAVFVLAELLGRNQEAVDYLERKGRIAQAAQLAETLALPAAVGIRLHCMAGDIERAVLLARLSNGFADAVAELERRQHAAAPGLRLEWAQELAARGHVVEAAAAIWRLEAERGRALAWLHAAEQAGGSLGVHGLLYKLALAPQSIGASGAAVHDLLHATGPDGAHARGLACDHLLQLGGGHAILRRLAAELWRSLVADGSAESSAIEPAKLGKLLALADDRTLAADAPAQRLPVRPAPVPLSKRADMLRVTCAERGLLPLEDVRLLPDGRYLLALGESGVAIARADGSVAVRFPIPAHQLVVSDNGRRALAVAVRERAVRVGRIDLLTHKAGDWFSAALRHWARDYDGATWSVVADERLMVLDTAAPGQSVLWQVSDLPGRIIGFDQQDNMQALLLKNDTTVEQWRYTLPERRLLQRDGHALTPETAIVLADSQGHAPIMLGLQDASREGDGTPTRLLIPKSVYGAGGNVVLNAPKALEVSLHRDKLLLQMEDADGWHCQLVDFAARVLLDIVLPDAQRARACVHDGHVLAWDKGGRLVDVEIATARARTVTFG